MPLPAILAGLWWIVGPAILGGASVYGASKLVGFFLDDEADEIGIAVLGPRGSGKTTLIRYLSDEIIFEYPSATSVPDKYDGFSIKRGENAIHIKSGRDVPGSPDFYSAWEEEFKNASLVLYLMNAYKASVDKRYRNSILRDIKKLRTWCCDEDRDPERFVPEIWIVGTHCDLIDQESSENRGEFEDRVRKESGFDEIRMTMGKYIVTSVLGSLKDFDVANEMVSKILSD